MGLTTCPKCGKTVSEKAEVCPHCNSGISKNSLTVCEDCKKEYDMSMVSCPYCGRPNSAVKQKKKRKGIITFIIVFALLAAGVSAIGISEKAKELKYYSNMEAVSFTMLDGAAKAEKAGSLIKKVWYNAIYEERDSETDRYTVINGKFADDFNDALSNLFADENFSGSISEIETNRANAADLMKQLKKPPKKYEEAYSVLMIYYDNYMKMTKIVISPTGSFNTFSEDFNNFDSNTIDAYEKMKLYLD